MIKRTKEKEKHKNLLKNDKIVQYSESEEETSESSDDQERVQFSTKRKYIYSEHFIREISDKNA